MSVENLIPLVMLFFGVLVYVAIRLADTCFFRFDGTIQSPTDIIATPYVPPPKPKPCCAYCNRPRVMWKGTYDSSYGYEPCEGCGAP